MERGAGAQTNKDSNFPAEQAEGKKLSAAPLGRELNRELWAQMWSPERGCSPREGAAIRGEHLSLLPGPKRTGLSPDAERPLSPPRER